MKTAEKAMCPFVFVWIQVSLSIFKKKKKKRHNSYALDMEPSYWASIKQNKSLIPTLQKHLYFKPKMSIYPNLNKTNISL